MMKIDIRLVEFIEFFPSADVMSESVIILRCILQLFSIFRVLISFVNLAYASMRNTSFFFVVRVAIGFLFLFHRLCGLGFV